MKHSVECRRLRGKVLVKWSWFTCYLFSSSEPKAVRVLGAGKVNSPSSFFSKTTGRVVVKCFMWSPGRVRAKICLLWFLVPDGHQNRSVIGLSQIFLHVTLGHPSTQVCSHKNSWINFGISLEHSWMFMNDSFFKAIGPVRRGIYL